MADETPARPARLKELLGPGDWGPGRRMLVTLLSLAVGAAVWLPCVHLIFAARAGAPAADAGISPRARQLAERNIRLWTDPALRAGEIRRMRTCNAEWDFMGRTFLVLALANMSLREPAEKERCLEAIDRIVAETLAIEREKGFIFFLMPYGQNRDAFVEQPARSIFVDGEIALMLGARRLVEEKPEYGPLLAERVKFIEERMRRGPVLCAESYPDECWMFCNTAALAALRLSDALDGTDHSALFRDWLAAARKSLVEPKTGMLISSFNLGGQVMDGPEGSSIWMAAHCLQLVDPEFAADQYARARRELGRDALGFAYAREWPAAVPGRTDVDSGPVVPGLGASASASGLGMMAAASFGDGEYFRKLAAALELAGFPQERDGGLRYAASNQLGDSVVLYSMTLGPLWRKVGPPASPAAGEARP